MARSLSILSVALACAGCGIDADIAAVQARPVCDTDTFDTDAVCKDIYGGSSSSGADWTGTGGIMTTTIDPDTTGGVASEVSGDGDGGSSSSDGAGPPGDADAGLSAKLSVSTAQVFEVMDVDVALTWSGPVSAVDLHLGDMPLVIGAPPAAALYTLKVTSDDVPGNGKRDLCALVHAVDGRTVSTCTELDIAVTKGGEEDWKTSPFDTAVSALTSAAVLGDGLAIAGYMMPQGEVPKLVVAVLDADGNLRFAPRVFDHQQDKTITWSGEASGPALTVDPDGSIYVAATVVDGSTTRRMIRKLDPDTLEDVHDPRFGNLDEDATALALCQGRVVVVGSVRTATKPNRYDLRVWWLSEESGFEIGQPSTFAAPPSEDDKNALSERAYGVACVGGEVVVVGTRGVWPDVGDPEHVRTVVLRFAAPGAVPDVWTSPGDVLAEDAALAVTPTKNGGFAVTGWTREQGPGGVRQVLSRRFGPGGVHLWPRPELTPSGEAIGRALAEDLEEKLIIVGGRKQPMMDWNAWILAAADQNSQPVWDKVYDVDQGPDEALGLALDAWGYPHVVGTEFEDLKMRAFALRLYP